MKAILMIGILLSAGAYAQIPENIQKRFNFVQPGARFIEWNEETGKGYRVTYTAGFRQSLVFDKNAEIIISESELPQEYIPKKIRDFVDQYQSRNRFVVWDSFDEQNKRSYFIICNENKKLSFTGNCEYLGEKDLTTEKKNTLLTFSSNK